LDEIGSADSANDNTTTIPSITLDLWFEVEASDLHLVIPILPSTAWAGNQVGVRIEFAPRNTLELLQNYRERKISAEQQLATLQNAGEYIPWPKSLTAYLEKELHSEFELKYFVLDRARFNSQHIAEEGYVPSPLTGELKGPAVLQSLVKVDCLHAQRHLADPSTKSQDGGRAEDLSRRLSRFYERNLQQREEDHAALKALFDSEAGLNEHLKNVFSETLRRLENLGYPGLHNPRLEIKSALNPASVMRQDARVHYVLGEEATSVRLPDSYNGLGFKNLIYMVVEILDLQESWRELENPPPLHIIFIEEPEAHLHAQLQQVFIRNVLELLNDPEADAGIFSSQTVVTTHSPHILYERGFNPIRYFRRHVNEGEQTTQVLNLSNFQAGENPKDKTFLQRYLKLTHCDLFFADATVLVEGNVERLLLPVMIEQAAKTLRSASLCILEVGGAFGHRFKELIEFLGITTLIITDLDSVTAIPTPTETDTEGDDEGGDEDEDEIEFEVPVDGDEAPQKRYGKTCLPNTPNAVTSNQTLIQWLPGRQSINDLWAASDEVKTQNIVGSEPSKIRVAYQTPVDVSLRDIAEGRACGRTLEESFGLENANWCQHRDRKAVGLKLRSNPTSIDALALGLHKRVTGKSFNKTNFALQLLTFNTGEWQVPNYIKEGLTWLESIVSLEARQEAEANLGAPIIEDTNADHTNAIAAQ
jgi:hypothetical protein